MQDSITSLIEKWKRLDAKAKIIYVIIALVLVAALIFAISTLSSADGNTEHGGNDLNGDIGFYVSDADISVTDGMEENDPADYSGLIDAGGTDGTDESTATTKKTKKTKTTTEKTTETSVGTKVKRDGQYQTRDEVAEYIASFGCLPSNYITKNQAADMGWVASKGNLRKVAPGMSIGGDKFTNREGILPKKSGRKYFECDIDYEGGTRNAKRIVFSNDGLIFYTDDHYSSYVQYNTETGEWEAWN